MSTSYCYDYPRPAVTTDVALFCTQGAQRHVLLIKRANAPHAGQWALPGGFLDMEEDLVDCAHRELAEETHLSGITLTQLAVFGRPDRDPRGRVISVAYYAVVACQDLPPLRAASDAAEAAWFPTDALPALAFDHDDIIRTALQRLPAASLNGQ